jgi:uncharacterized membrane protein YqjE
VNGASQDLRGLLNGIVTDTKAVLQAELHLARRELSDNVARAGTGLLCLGLGALVALVGLGALALAAGLGIAASGIAPHWAALIVAVACLVIALLCIGAGRARLSASALTPHRTLGRLRSDIDSLKEMGRADHRSA